MSAVAAGALSPETSESQVCAPWHPTSPVVQGVLGQMVPCLGQHQGSLAISPFSKDEESGGAVPRGPGEVWAQGSLHSPWELPRGRHGQ